MSQFFFFFFLIFKFHFMYKEPFCSKVDVLNDPFTEVHLVQLNEAYILRVLTETLAAHVKAVLPDQAVLVWVDAARTKRTLAEFSRMAPVELLVTHLVLSAATRMSQFSNMSH